MEQASAQSALSHYLRVIRRGAWIVILTAVVVTAVAIVTSRSQEKLYQASAEVFLSGARNLPQNLSDVSQFYMDPVRAAETQARLARVPEVAERAVDSSRFGTISAKELLGQSSVTPNADADILTFSVTDGDPATASALATAYARAFSDYRRRLDTQSIVQAQRQLEQRLTQLEREGGRGSGLYRELSRNDQELRTFEALQGSNTAVIRGGGDDVVQTQPKTARNATLGLVLGLVLGLALAFVRDALNTRVRSAEEIGERLGVPLIGRIPQLPKRLVGDDRVAMLTDPAAPETEVFRILSTNVGFANLDRGAKTIMVTSAGRGEGKSTTVANTAVALARAGSRVALVDLDLKRPALDRMFGLRQRSVPGITDVVLGSVPLNEALVRIPIIGPHERVPGARSGSEGALAVLQTGSIPPNTPDFVASGRLGTVLDQLASQCDLVLIDAPPILQVSDAMALTAKVDALLVVTRLTAIRRPALNELRRVMDSAPVAKLGFVLTGVRAQDGYGYGYGHALDEQATNGAGHRLYEKV